jgi:hypothetical protein
MKNLYYENNLLIKPCLIGFNRNKNQILENVSFLEKNEFISVYSSWAIPNELQLLYKDNLPFNLFINTGNKKIEYAYTITDFVTKLGSSGISCPLLWQKFITAETTEKENILSSSNFKMYPENRNLVIKTWFLVSDIIIIKDNPSWDNLLSIYKSKLKNPGKSYFLFAIDPLININNFL